jgi:predicted ATPase
MASMMPAAIMESTEFGISDLDHELDLTSAQLRDRMTPTPKAPRTKRSHMSSVRNKLLARSLGKTDKTGKLLVRKTVGREVEMNELRTRIDTLGRDKEDAGILIIEGEVGIGKTHLCNQAEKLAGRRDMMVLRGDCNAVKDSTPYYPWQNVLEEFFGVRYLPEDEATDKIMKRLADDFPDLCDRAGLLDAVLPLPFQQSPKTQMLKGFSRMENTKRLLLELLQKASESEQMVLILEDIHWMDTLSWSLLADIAASVHPLFIILTHRLWVDDAGRPTEYDELLQSGRAQLFSLGGITRNDSTQLACRCLRCDEVPEVIMSIVVNRASGNPFFVETSAKYLLQSKMVYVKKIKPRDGRDGFLKCVTGDDFGASTLPANGFASCEARFGLLDEQLRLILKVASVIAGPFTETMMKGIHPFPSQLLNLSENLEKLQVLGFVATQSYQRPHEFSFTPGGNNQLFSFQHSILQDMIYGMMPQTQQQELHKAAARYYEACRVKVSASAQTETEREISGDTDSSPGLDLALAHHWLHTAEPVNAARPLIAAGWDSLRRFANAEAVEHFTQAFDLIPRSAVTGSVSRSRLFLMAGKTRARSHCRFVLPPIHFIPDLLTY